jgi:branched-chain amino acid transport system permease protein
LRRHQHLSIAGGRAVLAVAALALLAAPTFLDAGGLTVLTEFLCLLVLALMWNLLAGYADIVTVGQHAFVGVGAYAFYGAVVLLGVDPYLAFGAAALTAFVIALPAMLIVFRLRAAYLAVGTWVVAEVLMLIAGKLPGFGFGSGVSLPVRVAREFGARPDARFATIYWLAFALAAAAFASTWLLLRSRIGLGLMAMRDNEEAAGAMGVHLVRARIVCFLWTAPFLGLAGAIITLQKLRISPPASFSIIDWTVFVIFNVVIGGIGSLEGPILGTVLFFLLREYLAQLGTWHLIILGTLSIAVILIEPRGLWGLLRRALGGDLIPVSHRARPGFGAGRKPGA